MQEYTSAILALAAVSVLSLLLFPDGQEKTKKTFTFALSLIALAILARPLAALRLPSFSADTLSPPDLGAIIEGAQASTFSEIEAAVARGIEADIASKFSLSPSSVHAEASLTLCEGELSVAALTLSLGTDTLFTDPITILEYARKTYTENCEVKTNAG